ncbi:MAG TPA: serpin family protein [Kofleriaceae bacterium]|nr:serpin family protein [Kofleriaceae bacterium]
MRAAWALAAVAAMSCKHEREVAMPADAASLAAASNAFGFELWARLGRSGNLAISPFSVTSAFAMTGTGASGTTAAQIRTVFHFATQPGPAWGQLAAALEAPSRPNTLRIANRLFGARGFALRGAFVDGLAAGYDAPFEQLDVAQPAAARAAINRWVEERTEHHIRELMPEGSITARTRLIVVDAIYFHGEWQTRFRPELTSDAAFHPTATASKLVKTMNGAAERYAHVDGVSLVELPYKGGATVMVIALPDRVDGLAALEAGLDARTFARWLAAIQPAHAVVALPRFELAARAIDLVPALRALGMPDAFDPDKADFSAIAELEPSQRLFVSAVAHAAYVEVDERGTEAAAATGASVEIDTARPDPIPRVICDHPFAFFIVDQPSGLVLFMGHVTDPS